jgi:hypothetical protein
MSITSILSQSNVLFLLASLLPFNVAILPFFSGSKCRDFVQGNNLNTFGNNFEQNFQNNSFSTAFHHPNALPDVISSYFIDPTKLVCTAKAINRTGVKNLNQSEKNEKNEKNDNFLNKKINYNCNNYYSYQPDPMLFSKITAVAQLPHIYSLKSSQIYIPPTVSKSLFLKFLKFSFFSILFSSSIFALSIYAFQHQDMVKKLHNYLFETLNHTINSIKLHGDYTRVKLGEFEENLYQNFAEKQKDFLTNSKNIFDQNYSYFFPQNNFDQFHGGPNDSSIHIDSDHYNSINNDDSDAEQLNFNAEKELISSPKSQNFENETKIIKIETKNDENCFAKNKNNNFSKQFSPPFYPYNYYTHDNETIHPVIDYDDNTDAKLFIDMIDNNDKKNAFHFNQNNQNDYFFGDYFYPSTWLPISSTFLGLFGSSPMPQSDDNSANLAIECGDGDNHNTHLNNDESDEEI